VRTKIRVADIAFLGLKDIDSERHLDVAVIDGFIKRTIAAVTTCLKSPPVGYSELQAVHISWLFEAMGLTHVTIRQLLREESRTPACVDALPLARLQLEGL